MECVWGAHSGYFRSGESWCNGSDELENEFKIVSRNFNGFFFQILMQTSPLMSGAIDFRVSKHRELSREKHQFGHLESVLYETTRKVQQIKTMFSVNRTK